MKNFFMDDPSSVITFSYLKTRMDGQSDTNLYILQLLVNRSSGKYYIYYTKITVTYYEYIHT